MLAHSRPKIMSTRVDGDRSIQLSEILNVDQAPGYRPVPDNVPSSDNISGRVAASSVVSRSLTERQVVQVQESQFLNRAKTALCWLGIIVLIIVYLLILALGHPAPSDAIALS